MFRVPANPDAPTFDDTFTVGFGKWLTSSAAERKEWARRRNAAARLAASRQRQRADDWAARTQAEARARMDAAKGQMRRAEADYQERVQQIDAERDRKLAELDARRDEARQQYAEQRPAEQPVEAQDAGTVSFGKFILDRDHIQRGMFDRRPVAGVTATVGDLERTKTRKAMAAARVLTGSIAATADALGRIGARQLTITGPDFEWTAEVPSHKVAEAQAFADQVNAAAQQ